MKQNQNRRDFFKMLGLGLAGAFAGGIPASGMAPAVFGDFSWRQLRRLTTLEETAYCYANLASSCAAVNLPRPELFKLSKKIHLPPHTVAKSGIDYYRGLLQKCPTDFVRQCIAHEKEILSWVQIPECMMHYSAETAAEVKSGLQTANRLYAMSESEYAAWNQELKAEIDGLEQKEWERERRGRTQRYEREKERPHDKLGSKVSFIAKPNGEKQAFKIKARAKNSAHQWAEPITERRIARSLEEPDNNDRSL